MANKLTPDSWLTTIEVASFVGFDVSSIINWSNQGRIKCFKTPGGHRRFVVSDVVAFIRTQGFPMPKSLAPIAEKVAVS